MLIRIRIYIPRSETSHLETLQHLTVVSLLVFNLFVYIFCSTEGHITIKRPGSIRGSSRSR